MNLQHGNQQPAPAFKQVTLSQMCVEKKKANEELDLAPSEATKAIDKTITESNANTELAVAVQEVDSYPYLEYYGSDGTQYRKAPG